MARGKQAKKAARRRHESNRQKRQEAIAKLQRETEARIKAEEAERERRRLASDISDLEGRLWDLIGDEVVKLQNQIKEAIDTLASLETPQNLLRKNSRTLIQEAKSLGKDPWDYMEEVLSEVEGREVVIQEGIHRPDKMPVGVVKALKKKRRKATKSR